MINLTTTLAKYDVMPDWSTSANPHLAVVGPQARRIGSLLFSEILKNQPTVVLGRLKRSMSLEHAFWKLAEVDLLAGSISASAMPLFDELIRTMSDSSLSLATLVRQRRQQDVSTGRLRVACRPRQDLDVHLRGIAVQGLVEHAARLGYAAPEFNLGGSDISAISLRNDPSLLSQSWRAVVSWTNGSDSLAYEADGLDPEFTAQALDNEIEASALEISMTRALAGQEELDSSELHRLAISRVGDLWSLAAIGSGTQEKSRHPDSLRQAVDALRSVGQGCNSVEGIMADQLVEMLGGTTVLDLDFGKASPHFIDIADASPLRLAVMLGSIFSMAARQSDAGLPKFIIMDISDSGLAQRPAVSSAIECLLRQGRKYNCWCVILADRMESIRHPERSIDPERLCGSLMVDVTMPDFTSDRSDDLPFDWRQPGVYWWLDASLTDPVVVCPAHRFEENPQARVAIPWTKPS